MSKKKIKGMGSGKRLKKTDIIQRIVNLFNTYPKELMNHKNHGNSPTEVMDFQVQAVLATTMQVLHAVLRKNIENLLLNF